jgi:acyl carrier protein
VRWLNGYGPTEATITATTYEAAGRDLPAASVPIGRPIDNVKLYVVDSHEGLSPIGAAGELWIGGAGLARGYRGDPERTAEKFLADPFGKPGERIYRTGDRVRYLADGNLEFLGRLDSQVKIRGFRIELGEIETAIEQHPEVREAAVVGRDEGAAAQLAAYFVPQSAGSVAAAQLKAFLKTKLPAYMLPASYVALEVLPRTANGKVDRARLPEPGRSREDAADFVAPRTPVEQSVAGIWAELLRLDRVGATDNFFDLGGHSLLATQVVSRLRDAFGIEVPLRALFESPTVAELSLSIAQVQAQQAAPDDLARLLEELESETPTSSPGTSPSQGK